MAILYLFLLPIVHLVEKIALHKIISVKKLTEGDWITQNLYLNNKLIYNKKSPGVTKEQINKILRSKVKKVKVREGIPFIPSFLIALIITLIFKNLVYHIL